MTRILIDSETKTIYEAIDSVAAVLITDINGHFIYVNKNLCDLTGYKSIELIGKPASIFKSGYHSDLFYKELWEVLLSGKTWRGLFCNKTKSGELIWLDTIIKPIVGQNNKIEKFIGIRLNVTELMENKIVIKNQEEQLKSVSRFATLGEISGYIAHEISNPLTVLSLAVSTLKQNIESEKPDAVKIKNLSIKIQNVSNRMTKIVQALRNHSRSATDQIESCNLKEIFNDVELLTEDMTKSKDIELIYENKAEIDIFIHGQKIQLAQVLINLIKNACDAIESLEIKRINISVNKQEGILFIAITDSGTISEEVAAKLFTPYFTTKSEGAGTGIGLSISRQIIEAHGGKIYLDPYSVKTRFVIQLPI